MILCHHFSYAITNTHAGPARAGAVAFCGSVADPCDLQNLSPVGLPPTRRDISCDSCSGVFTPLYPKLYLFYLCISAFRPKNRRVRGAADLIFSSCNSGGFVESGQYAKNNIRRVYLPHQCAFVIKIPLFVQNFPFYVNPNPHVPRNCGLAAVRTTDWRKTRQTLTLCCIMPLCSFLHNVKFTKITRSPLRQNRWHVRKS